MWQKIVRLIAGRTAAQDAGGEADVQHDPAEAKRRATGGEPDPETGDTHSTTGPSANETFVGRVAGEDAGYAGQTGAEARTDPSSTRPDDD
jgi:hypothetical protein